MEKQKILDSELWKYISSLSQTLRHSALFGNSQCEVEKVFNVEIKEFGFTQLSEIPNNYVKISVIDNFKNLAFIAVLIPKESNN